MGNRFFVTDQFGLEADQLVLLRKGFTVERIPFSRIEIFRIRKARVVKNPILLGGFGLACFIPLLWFSNFWYEVFSNSKFDLSQLSTSQGYHRAIAIQIIVVGFCTFVGGMALFKALKKSISLEVKLKDQRTFFFDLEPLIKSDQIGELKSFLKLKNLSLDIY